MSQIRRPAIRKVAWFAVAACFFCFLASRPCPVPAAATEPGYPSVFAIQVKNFTNGQTLRYPVPFLQGTLADKSINKIVVTNLSSSRDTREMTGVAENGRFKALIELCPGTNHLRLKAGDKTTEFELIYQPQTNPHFIRAVLFTDETGDTRYASPLPNDPQNFRGKFDALLKIMQSFTADWMEKYGYGRRTFNLELDRDGKVIVHVVKGKRPADYYRYQLNRDQLYDVISDETQRGLPDTPSVDCTLIAFSKMDPKLGHSVAYTALGGSKIALFGGACVYAFPDSLTNVQTAFTNPTLIDDKKYVSDSVDRFTFWATASTSIGAMLHEMGHSMGLPHSDDPRDMMTRGIDNFGRYWVFYDPPSRQNSQVYHYTDDEIGDWSPVSAAALAPTVWLDLDKRNIPPQAPTTVDLTPDGSQFIIRNQHGLGFVGYERPGVAHAFHKIDYTAPLPRELQLPAQDVFDAVGKDSSQFRIIDADGRMSTFNLNEYGWAFVRRWHYCPQTMPWPDHTKLPNLSDAQLDAIFRAAMGQSPQTSSSGQISFPEQREGHADAAYAALVIQSRSQQDIKIYTGSHDGIRVWLNGKVVTQVAGARDAKPDSESNAATLRAGNNQILIEVTSADGKGQFYFRMTGANGSGLRVRDDGLVIEIKSPELLQNKK